MFGFPHDPCLQGLRRVPLFNGNGFLQENFTAVHFAVYIMYRSSRNFYAVIERRFVRNEAVEAFSAKGRDQRRVYVDDFIFKFFEKRFA